MTKFYVIVAILFLALINESYGTRKKKLPRPCDFRCSKKVSEIKDKNGNTYTSRCEMKRARCLEKTCKLLTPRSCPSDARPVCGSNRKNYDNLCLFCVDRKKLFRQGLRLYFSFFGHCGF